MSIQKGEIYMAQLTEQPNGSIQAGHRPVLICSSDINNRHSTILNYIPITSKKKKNLPVHVQLHNCGLERESIALVEQISVINKSELGKRIGKINPECERELRKAISIQLGL